MLRLEHVLPVRLLNVGLFSNVDLDVQITRVSLFLQESGQDTDVETGSPHPPHVLCTEIGLGQHADALTQEAELALCSLGHADEVDRRIDTLDDTQRGFGDMRAAVQSARHGVARSAGNLRDGNLGKCFASIGPLAEPVEDFVG